MGTLRVGAVLLGLAIVVAAVGSAEAGGVVASVPPEALTGTWTYQLVTADGTAVVPRFEHPASGGLGGVSFQAKLKDGRATVAFVLRPLNNGEATMTGVDPEDKGWAGPIPGVTMTVPTAMVWVSVKEGKAWELALRCVGLAPGGLGHVVLGGWTPQEPKAEDELEAMKSLPGGGEQREFRRVILPGYHKVVVPQGTWDRCILTRATYTRAKTGGAKRTTVQEVWIGPKAELVRWLITGEQGKPVFDMQLISSKQ